MIRSSVFIFVTLLVFLAGCSQEPEKTAPTIQDTTDSNQSNAPSEIQNPSDSDQHEPNSDLQSPTDPGQSDPQTTLTDEQILMKPPGQFAGSNYNEQNVQAALDQLSPDLTADQYEEELLLLLAEDYRPYVTTFINFETEIKVNNQRPSAKITLPSSRKLHISILLDASGSMKAEIAGKSKMDSAKEAILSFAEKMPENAEVSLRVYGHKGTGNKKDKEVSCKSTEEIFHGQGEETNQIKTVLQGVKPAGWTPIANALKSVKQDINPETTNSIVYVVSDGIETCGGNPVQIAKELNQAKVKTVVNIIGFDVDHEGQKLLRQVATSGGGEFISVDNDEALKKYLDKTYDKLRGEWTLWKEKGAGEANIKKETKQGTINKTQETMQGLVNKENANLLAALTYLETKNGKAFPRSELLTSITERKNFAWTYARDTGKRLYEEVSKNGNKVYDDIIDEGNKQVNELTSKKNNKG
ncbi:vWA domain-containing protein [Paenibacillus mendelii]|uniref:VWA domain-containing protein n=1 Tax=Paenibacillus mendelii TaxID=206163 RepID=A0ABV6J531_9BACL|nr:VWA domain-containing protein [Paenibacillus mendelii]MCQ6562845.1 VWA domain-containing protein [Paenibacillus mendelii]